MPDTSKLAYANFIARRFAARHHLNDLQGAEIARLCMLAVRYADHRVGRLWFGQAVAYSRRCAGAAR